MACETEMHVHYVMLAQDHYRAALRLPCTFERSDRISLALETLDEAERWGVPAHTLCEIRKRYHTEWVRCVESEVEHGLPQACGEQDSLLAGR